MQRARWVPAFFLGPVKTLERVYWHFWAFIIIVFLILFYWPAYQGVRFVFPVLPFISFFLVKGLEYLFVKYEVKNKYKDILLVSYLSLMLIVGVRASIISYKTDTNECYTSEMKEIYTFISKNIGKEKIIAFEKPRVLRLFTDRNTIFSDVVFFDKSVASFLLIKKSSSDLLLNASNHKLILETSNYYLISKT